MKNEISIALRHLTSAVFQGHGGPTRLATPAPCDETMSRGKVNCLIRSCHSTRHIQKLNTAQAWVSHSKVTRANISRIDNDKNTNTAIIILAYQLRKSTSALAKWNRQLETQALAATHSETTHIGGQVATGLLYWTACRLELWDSDAVFLTQNLDVG